MKNFKEFYQPDNGEEQTFDTLIISFPGLSCGEEPNFLSESLNTLEEGKTKQWRNGYSYRLDRRPDHMGGDQLHIFGRKGDKWAYRHDGSRSETNKYTSAITNTVKSIVSYVFEIDPSKIEEAIIVSGDDGKLLVEVTFA